MFPRSKASAITPRFPSSKDESLIKPVSPWVDKFDRGPYSSENFPLSIFFFKNWELGIPCRKSFMETLWIFNIQENLHPSFKEINKLGVFFFMENITMNFSRDKGSTMESWKAIRDNNESTCLVLDEECRNS